MKATPLEGGSAKVVDSSNFEVSKTIAMAEVTVEPGAMRYVFVAQAPENQTHTGSVVNFTGTRVRMSGVISCSCLLSPSVDIG